MCRRAASRLPSQNADKPRITLVFAPSYRVAAWTMDRLGLRPCEWHFASREERCRGYHGVDLIWVSTTLRYDAYLYDLWDQMAADPQNEIRFVNPDNL